MAVQVFDDYNGWDRLPHTDRQEFYNDFNDYTFSVKAPKNYVVYATGDLLNPDEVLQPEFSARLKKSYSTDEIFENGYGTPGQLCEKKSNAYWLFFTEFTKSVPFIS